MLRTLRQIYETLQIYFLFLFFFFRCARLERAAKSQMYLARSNLCERAPGYLAGDGKKWKRARDRSGRRRERLSSESGRVALVRGHLFRIFRGTERRPRPVNLRRHRILEKERVRETTTMPHKTGRAAPRFVPRGIDFRARGGGRAERENDYAPPRAVFSFDSASQGHAKHRGRVARVPEEGFRGVYALSLSLSRINRASLLFGKRGMRLREQWKLIRPSFLSLSPPRASRGSNRTLPLMLLRFLSTSVRLSFPLATGRAKLQKQNAPESLTGNMRRVHAPDRSVPYVGRRSDERR